MPGPIPQRSRAISAAPARFLIDFALIFKSLGMSLISMPFSARASLIPSWPHHQTTYLDSPASLDQYKEKGLSESDSLLIVLCEPPDSYFLVIVLCTGRTVLSSTQKRLNEYTVSWKTRLHCFGHCFSILCIWPFVTFTSR